VVVVAEAEVTARSPAGDVVLAYIRKQVLAIARYDPLVRRDAPDAVHQMRVATRRARSALQAFGQIIDRAATRSLGDELKWLAAELGHARDSEVMQARLTAELAAIPLALVVGPVEARITGHFTAELAQAGKAAAHALDGPRYLRLRDDLDVLLADPPLTPLAGRKAGKALVKPVRRTARRLQRALAALPAAEDRAAEDRAAEDRAAEDRAAEDRAAEDRAAEDRAAEDHAAEDWAPEDRDTAIHEARKAAKRARYAAEAAAPALGGPASRQAAQAKELQELLGDHHDSVVARTVLLGLADQARAAGEDTFPYGVMYERQAGLATEIERELPHASPADGG
jgi:CHAD domain-containing protein